MRRIANAYFAPSHSSSPLHPPADQTSPKAARHRRQHEAYAKGSTSQPDPQATSTSMANVAPQEFEKAYFKLGE